MLNFEVSFHLHCIGNPTGGLCRLSEKLYCGIYSEWTQLFTRLFQDNVIQDRIDRGLLIEAELTPLVAGGYGIVERH
jgi:hypothetical protein